MPRSSKARGQPSSPPQAQPSFTSHSSGTPPSPRRTRSASTELGISDAEAEAEAEAKVGRKRRRSKRQASVESIDSNSSMGSRRRWQPREAGRTDVNSDLSMVAEEGRESQDEEGLAQQTPRRRRDAAVNALPSQSPGDMSQMSGTTAMTSFTAATTHSTTVLAELDPILVEFLPELLTSSCKILDLLAPPGASQGVVEAIVKELKVLGSKRAKLLRHNEGVFTFIRDRFGSDHFINIVLILRKLFGSREPEEEDFRPDAILHAANLATSINEFLVMEKESQSMQHLLAALDTHFPEVFITRFDANVKYGNSRLRDETFAMGLDIRTYCAVSALGSMKGQEEWDPDEVLLGIFYDPLPDVDPSVSLSLYDHALRHGSLREIMRQGPPNSDRQVQMILKRVGILHSTFRQGGKTPDQGDLVDFELLEERFPWPLFLTNLVLWCRSRLDEITKSVRDQGGVESIAKYLAEAIEATDTQVDEDHKSPLPAIDPHLPPTPLDITRGVDGKSLYTKNNASRLFQLKRQQSSYTNPSSSQPALANQSSRLPELAQPGPSKGRDSTTSMPTNSLSDSYTPTVGGEYEDIPSTAKPALDVWKAHNNDNNKENRPVSNRPFKKPSLLDRQHGAHKVDWDAHSQEAATNQKRTHPSQDDMEEDDLSQDEGFQNDARIPDPNRRGDAVRAHRRPPSHDTGPPTKRTRPDKQGARETVHINHERLRGRLQSSAGDQSDDDDREEELLPPTFAEIQSIGQELVPRRPYARPPQIRTPWSKADTDLLISLIENRGTSWSLIERCGKFEVPRGQVALKDKARNVKVDYLKRGFPLPYNFEHVRLGRKEINIVRTYVPNYDPDAYEDR